MLSISDTDLNLFLPFFAQTGVPVAFLVPTPTGYGKAIMDATGPVRTLLYNEHIHDYSVQGQGPSEKKLIPTFFIHKNHIEQSTASVYRPVTKKGDPRIWFSGLRKYCRPCNLLALFVMYRHICVLNLSDPGIAESLLGKGYAYSVIQEAVSIKTSIARELLKKIKDIHNQGWLPSITPGDPGVGDTLEHALGISRNNSKKPDYKGIELKASRLTIDGKKKQETRRTLFTKVPDEGLSYRQIVEQYGKWQTPKGEKKPRFQLYETLCASRPNAYGLLIAVEESNEKLDLLYDNNQIKQYVSAWFMDKLQEQLSIKHHETFWVKANTIRNDEREFFHYDFISHTRKPNITLLGPLLDMDKITIDLAAHINEDGGWRDHGVLFKMKQKDFPLLFGEQAEYNLNLDISIYLDALDENVPAYVAEQFDLAPVDYKTIPSTPDIPIL